MGALTFSLALFIGVSVFLSGEKKALEILLFYDG